MEEKQILTLTDGRILTLNGVKNIMRFDESAVTLDTSGGRIVIEGEGLTIESLGKEAGDILVKGNVYGVYRYEEPERKEGIFKRLFSSK